ncbi:MAG: zinc-binding dehydrogenase [Candidatus Methanofastidiosia archaeon]
MKVALFLEKGKPLKLTEVKTPKPLKREVLVKVSACGLCRTDLHYLHGVPTFKKPPIILGHEISGVVSELGEGVSGFKKGDKVLIPPVFGCGDCFFCRTGRSTLCSKGIMVGNHIDGGFAEYISVPKRELFLLPEKVPLREGCIIADALSTPYHAVKNRGKVKLGDSVVVFGCGGVGLGVVQMASIAGGKVIAVDIEALKLEQAEKFGAFKTINAREEDVLKVIKKLTYGGADIVFEVIGNPKTIEQAFNAVRRGGRVVVVGYTHQNVALNAGRLMFREIEVLGSLGCGEGDFPRLLELVSSGRVKVKEMVTHRFSLDEINKGFELLERGEPSMIRGIVVME